MVIWIWFLLKFHFFILFLSLVCSSCYGIWNAVLGFSLPLFLFSFFQWSIEGLRIRKAIKCPGTQDKKGHKTSFRTFEISHAKVRQTFTADLQGAFFVWWSLSGSYPEKYSSETHRCSLACSQRVRLVRGVSFECQSNPTVCRSMIATQQTEFLVCVLTSKALGVCNGQGCVSWTQLTQGRPCTLIYCINCPLQGWLHTVRIFIVASYGRLCSAFGFNRTTCPYSQRSYRTSQQRLYP